MLIVTIFTRFLGNELSYSFEPEYIIPLLFLGIISMGFSVQFWFYGVKRLGVTQASLLQNLAPVFVMLIMLVLGKSFEVMKVIGGALVILAAVITQIEKKYPKLEANIIGINRKEKFFIPKKTKANYFSIRCRCCTGW